MPRSKRDRVVALTQTSKKGKEAKGKLIDEVREQAEQFSYLWVFEVEHMRNNLLQEVRTAWKGSKYVYLPSLPLTDTYERRRRRNELETAE
jgi:mRNA turnover protein 4